MRCISRPCRVWTVIVCAALSIGFALIGANVDAQSGVAASNRVQLDTSDAIPIYVNYARVTGTPDEVIIDVGIFANAADEPVQPIKIHHELVMNYYTLKRLASSLNATLERHEATFGPIELDVSKRVRN